jgi:multidrug efflux pump subunit AcrA (membrane-fusion protein)
MTKYLFVMVAVMALAACGEKKGEPAEQTVVPVEIQKIVALGRVEPEVKITPIGSEVSGVVRRIYAVRRRQRYQGNFTVGAES